VKIAVLGGTGDFGLALAKRLVLAGEDVVIGSRDAQRAHDAAAQVGAGGATNEEAVRGAELVVLAVSAEAALSTAEALATEIDERPLLSVASGLHVTKAGAFPRDDERSLAERTQNLVAGPVVAGLHSLAAANLSRDEPPDQDALVCGDDEDAKALVLELADKVVGGRALDAGPLASARALEGLTAVILNLNRRYKVHAGVRVTGIA
jgi:8-hydroxy-5-deazaflavin:NADPH oxidoreductase